MVKLKKHITYEKAWYALAAARIMLGFIFLWSFLDKTMGLGFATPAARAWVNGGSPTTGFLKSVEGPFAGLFNGLAGNVLVDWLFMLALLGIGLALILGIGLRVAAVSATLLLGMMWLAEFPYTAPKSNNPLVDDHLVYIAVIWAAACGVRKWSLINTWLKTDSVKKNRWLW